MFRRGESQRKAESSASKGSSNNGPNISKASQKQSSNSSNKKSSASTEDHSQALTPIRDTLFSLCGRLVTYAATEAVLAYFLPSAVQFLRRVPVTTTNRRRSLGLSCPICLECISDLKEKKSDIITTRCGHIVCKPCIDSVFNTRNPLCPICRCAIRRDQIHKVFL